MPRAVPSDSLKPLKSRGASRARRGAWGSRCAEAWGAILTSEMTASFAWGVPPSRARAGPSAALSSTRFASSLLALLLVGTSARGVPAIRALLRPFRSDAPASLRGFWDRSFRPERPRESGLGRSPAALSPTRFGRVTFAPRLHAARFAWGVLAIRAPAGLGPDRFRPDAPASFLIAAFSTASRRASSRSGPGPSLAAGKPGLL